MSDRTHVHALVRDITRDASELQDAWFFEIEADAWTSSGDLTFVTGGGRSDPTGTRATTERHTDADRITADLEKVAAILRRRVEDLTTREPTPCNTTVVDDQGRRVSCTGTATRRGRCSKCAGFWRRNGYRPPAKTIRAWNEARPRWCDCSSDCCPRDAEGHTTCHDLAAEGRSVSERCKTRMRRRHTPDVEQSA